jgi:hypothetical protein
MAEQINVQDVVNKVPTSSFLASAPEPGQNVVLLTYGVPRQVTDGLYCIVKVIGTYANEQDAEKRCKVEMEKEHCKVTKIAPVGQWVRIVDPLAMKSFQYDKFHKGDIKHVVSSMNAAIEKKNKDDEQEIDEAVRKLRIEEAKTKANEDSMDNYMILVNRLEGLPATIAFQQGTADAAAKEIVRLTALEPELKKKIAAMEERNPGYKEGLKEYIEAIKKV